MNDITSENSSQETPITSEEVARQIKAATDPLTRQLELVYHFIKDQRQTSFRRNEEANSPD